MIRRNMQPTRIGALTMSGVAFTKGWIRTYPDRVDNATSRQVLKITTMLACQAWAPQRVNMALDFDSSCERKGIGVVSCSYGGMRSSAAICACAERERRKGAGAHLTLGTCVHRCAGAHASIATSAHTLAFVFAGWIELLVHVHSLWCPFFTRGVLASSIYTHPRDCWYRATMNQDRREPSPLNPPLS